MGKITGFLEFERQHEPHEPVETRLLHYQEFIGPLDDAAARTQGARCMDCGVPFCNQACPLNNLIPDWNDLVYQDRWRAAFDTLQATNNFPEFTSRICPAPCEAACTLGIDDEPVGIKSIERAISDKGMEQGWIVPQPARRLSGKRVAIVGSGPAGLAAAQQLARAGHTVTVYEKNAAAGGLLRYGIPDFKLDKRLIDTRLAQLEAEGVRFRLNTLIGDAPPPGIHSDAHTVLSADALLQAHDAVILAGGAETPRDLDIPGRDLAGIHFALEYLIAQNKAVHAGRMDGPANPIDARGRHVVVIGGGDTGSDCVGTANRQGAASVTQIELLPRPPLQENKALTWPYWPLRLRTSSSHEEGCQRDWAIASQAFIGHADGPLRGRLKALRCVRLDWRDGGMQAVAGSEFELPADLVFLAMGFTQPAAALLDGFAVARDARGNVAAATSGNGAYASSRAKVFAAGDMRRGQSLVVWAMREGRQCAQAVDRFLRVGA
ncbi:MAG TPA: glutamate synthase subunit beta [Thiobacillaceae bacterium]|nr:glutamate synthase subunit beta [Thiobacillaceae bacterium]HNU64479.1 glutamate synthase subunit beta [Thiobacillaceae bacterium]